MSLLSHLINEKMLLEQEQAQQHHIVSKLIEQQQWEEARKANNKWGEILERLSKVLKEIREEEKNIPF